MSFVRGVLWVALLLFVFTSYVFFRGLFWISTGAFVLAAPWLLLYSGEQEERRRLAERLKRMPQRKRSRARLDKISFLPPKTGELRKRWRFHDRESDGNGKH